MKTNILTAAIVAILGALWLYAVRNDVLGAIVAVLLLTLPGALMAVAVIGASELQRRRTYRREYRRLLAHDRRLHDAANVRIRPRLRPGMPDLPWQPDLAAIERAARFSVLEPGRGNNG